MNKRDDFLNMLRTALAVRLTIAALPAVLSLVGGPEAWATTDTTFAAPLTTVTDMVAGTGGQLAAVLAVGAALVGRCCGSTRPRSWARWASVWPRARAPGSSPASSARRSSRPIP